MVVYLFHFKLTAQTLERHTLRSLRAHNSHRAKTKTKPWRAISQKQSQNFWIYKIILWQGIDLGKYIKLFLRLWVFPAPQRPQSFWNGRRRAKTWTFLELAIWKRLAMVRKVGKNPTVTLKSSKSSQSHKTKI